MKNIQHKILILSFFIVSFLFLGQVSPSDAASNSLDVSVKAILPENQDSDVTYYDLRMNPSQQQDLQLDLTNSSDQEQVISLAIINATTNSTGSIDYSIRGKDYKQDNTLKIPMSSIVSVPKTVTIPAKTTTSTQLSVNMPPESFDGIILGAVRVSLPEEDDQSTSDSGSGVAIKNQIAYTIGIKLRETDVDIPAELDLIKVVAGQTSGRNTVLATVQNSTATVLENISYAAKVYHDGDDEVLHEAKVDAYRFAPNSHFDYIIGWEGQRFQSGMYQLKMTADSKDTGQHWEWDKKFEVTNNEARNLNDTAIDLDKDNTWLYVMLGIGLLILLLLLIAIIVYLKKRKSDQIQAEVVKTHKSHKKKKATSSSKKHQKKPDDQDQV